MALVEVNSVSKSYPRRVGLRTEQIAVVENVTFAIESGETLGLVGESGSGKTTLARMILGLVAPSRGSVRISGIDVARASRTEDAPSAPPDAARLPGPLRRPESAHECAGKS